MKKKSGNSSGRRLNQEQKTFLQMMALPAVVVILIVVIRIMERPKEESEESVEPPTVAMMETGITITGGQPDWEDERLPEEPGVNQRSRRLRRNQRNSMSLPQRVFRKTAYRSCWPVLRGWGCRWGY